MTDLQMNILADGRGLEVLGISSVARREDRMTQERSEGRLTVRRYLQLVHVCQKACNHPLQATCRVVQATVDEDLTKAVRLTVVAVVVLAVAQRVRHVDDPAALPSPHTDGRHIVEGLTGQFDGALRTIQKVLSVIQFVGDWILVRDLVHLPEYVWFRITFNLARGIDHRLSGHGLVLNALQDDDRLFHVQTSGERPDGEAVLVACFT